MKQNDPMTKVLGKLDDLTTEVKVLRSDVSTTKSDVMIQGLQLRTAETRAKAMQTDLSDLKKDVGGLKEDVSGLKEDVGGLKEDIRRVEVLHEETDGKIDHIIEVAAPSSKQITKMRKHSEKQDETISFHERRIGFLEKKVA